MHTDNGVQTTSIDSKYDSHQVTEHEPIAADRQHIRDVAAMLALLCRHIISWAQRTLISVYVFDHVGHDVTKFRDFPTAVATRTHYSVHPTNYLLNRRVQFNLIGERYGP